MGRGRHVSKAVLTGILGLFALTAALPGCGLFKARDPKKPAGQATACEPLTSPNNMVANILANYGVTGATSCYDQMVDTAFVFHPDPIDEAADPTAFTGWNQAVEKSVNSNIASDAQFIQTVFDSTYQSPTVTTSPQTETRYYAYHVLFRGLGQADTTRYQGKAEIKFALGTGSFWSIVDWRDYNDGSGLPTWGRLRANHRVGG